MKSRGHYRNRHASASRPFVRARLATQQTGCGLPLEVSRRDPETLTNNGRLDTHIGRYHTKTSR